MKASDLNDAMISVEALERVPISALQHWSYCPRQCMLIHQEQAFTENVHTMRGRVVHETVDTPGFEMCGSSRYVRALPLFCDRLGLVGRADLVEFLVDGTPYPIEYKHGPRRVREHDDIQLAAQAICLEAMTGKLVPSGAIYHATSRHRREVVVTAFLRNEVEHTVATVRAAMATDRLPPSLNDSRCRECSMRDICQPAAVAGVDRLSALRQELFFPDECNT